MKQSTESSSATLVSAPEASEANSGNEVRPASSEGPQGKFSHLMEEARFFFEGNDFLRALQLCKQAEAYMPGDLAVQSRAECFEIVHNSIAALERFEAELPELIANVQENPKCGEAHFAVAYRFDALGYTEEALAEYQRVLACFDTICPECQRDCLNNIGWIHYRAGNYPEAISWFDLALAIDDPKNPGPHRGASENRALAEEKLQLKGHSGELPCWEAN
jgi:tetratricopeptide (TPR) repeat protein